MRTLFVVFNSLCIALELARSLRGYLPNAVAFVLGPVIGCVHCWVVRKGKGVITGMGERDKLGFGFMIMPCGFGAEKFIMIFSSLSWF